MTYVQPSLVRGRQWLLLRSLPLVPLHSSPPRLRPGAAVAGAQAAPRPGIDQPAVTFKVEVNYVEVDAAVFDKSGKFVGTLNKDDFQVLEDGQPQEISAFTLVNIPIERADRPALCSQPIQPDVAATPSRSRAGST